ncbi:TPA: hypothetical protein RQK39_001613 [Vibrio vulnificus]|uniref:hypothetical protein n=1 Tax=Vibrio vulnificus TaxID=672 RepID=UPI0007EE8D53|nr:hypothetical protein [Vibrio vulnificus]ANN28157.1 hypothetical protein FORC17_3094 [Vibrio vulnificus]WHE23175.1 hypothetical protein PVE41_19290 [Vibrio vulnificus]HAS6201948.1 hypothetical protein [Vibrio vulnificus]HAS6206125.1 hypothetical protein [Vibrio vulnificus]HAS6216585.1 hypothetical protein [Vibrio vulnificus]
MDVAAGELVAAKTDWRSFALFTQWPVALLSGTVNRAKMLIRDWFGVALAEHQRHTLKGTN